MKKIYIAMTAILAVALTSCQVEEEPFNGAEIGENAVVFGIGRTAGTKAAQNAVVSRQSIEMPNDDVDGVKLFLEETVTLLDDCAPATKGTPAYTENVGTLYGSKLGVYSTNTNFGDATYEKMDDEMVGDGWRYQHNYATNPWPTNGSAVDFYFRMPTDMAGIDGAFTYGKADGKQTITFSYVTPESASAQQDILFGARSASKADYTGSLPNGIPVLLNHALTGVKFAIAEDIKATVMINSVSFSGIIDKGTCTVTPASENAYRDNTTTNYSSSTAAVWTDITRTADKVYSATYTDIVTYAANAAGSFKSAGDYPASFANGGNKNNLDDADGNAAQTFWLIPQVLEDAAKLTINYTVKSSPEATTGTSYTYTIDFGKTLKDKSVEWKAGELHTYTIRVDDVNVKIEDAVTIDGSADDGFVGSYKDKVTITNTGNTRAFIRAAIVGQWLDAEGNPVFGFTDRIDQLYVVESWYEDQFGAGGNHNHGEFSGLAGYTDAVNPDGANPFNGWTLCKDGYYYYTIAVDPGDPTGSPLFDKYTVKNRPPAQMAGQEQVRKDMYFSLEIATQAISAKKLDGSEYTWDEAWENASGVKPVKK